MPLQVVDRKGWRASHPKVVMATPYQDSIYTDDAGSELQQVLEHSPCVGSERERQTLPPDGLPGTLTDFHMCARSTSMLWFFGLAHRNKGS